jgi:hypothetical protein
MSGRKTRKLTKKDYRIMADLIITRKRIKEIREYLKMFKQELEKEKNKQYKLWVEAKDIPSTVLAKVLNISRIGVAFNKRMMSKKVIS